MNVIEQELQTLHIAKTEVIAAAPEAVWESLLQEMGPDSSLNPKESMNFVLEAFPGGRWYRDLGNGVGHLWGHVQVIKPNKVLEICGPMFMSFAAMSHVQYKLVPDGAKTRLELTHTAIGLIPADVAAGLQGGSAKQLTRIRELAERSAS